MGIRAFLAAITLYGFFFDDQFQFYILSQPNPGGLLAAEIRVLTNAGGKAVGVVYGGLRSLAGLKSPKPIHFDVGAGPNPRILSGHKNIGIDPAFALSAEPTAAELATVKAAQAAGLDALVAGDAARLPTVSNIADALTLRNVPPSVFTNPRVPQEFLRVLKSNGKVFVGGANVAEVRTAILKFAQNLGVSPPSLPPLPPAPGAPAEIGITLTPSQ